MPQDRAPALTGERQADAWDPLLRAADGAAWSWLAVALVLVVLGGLAAGLAPLALKAEVDAIDPPGLRSSRIGTGPIATYVGLLIVQRLCEQAQAYAYGRGEQRVARRLGGQAFARLLRLPLGALAQGGSGALTQAVAHGVFGARMVCSQAVSGLAPVLIQLAVAIVVFARTFGPGAALAFALAAGAYGVAFAWSARRLQAATRAATAQQAEAAGQMTDALLNAETIKAFTAETRTARRYDALLGVGEARWRTYLERRLGMGLGVAAAFAAILAVSLGWAARQAAIGAMSVGGFVLAAAYLLQLVRPLELAGFAARDIGQGLAHLEGLLALWRQPAEPGDGDGDGEAAPAPGPGAAELEFDDVSLAVPSGRTILRAVSFRAPPGALVAIVGPSGGGKSSLLRLVLRFCAPSGGEIRLDGRPLPDWPLHRLRGQIALVSQDTVLFSGTIADNIGFSVDDPEPEAIAAAAHAAALSTLIASLPQGMRTQVGERGLLLSGGEKQRIAIARALLTRARLLIFDEATAALDPETAQSLWTTLTRLAAGVTTLVVTHRLATVSHADLILVLADGAIVERGRHAALLQAGGLYARLWRAQREPGEGEAQGVA